MSEVLPIWQCETCGRVYAEYINGCPLCWERGIRSGVRARESAETIEEITADKGVTKG